MPPKNTGPSKKTIAKVQEKIIEDKTFGLKNKNKSKVVQNFVKGVANQVKGVAAKGGEAKRLAEEFAQKANQKKEEEKKALLASLFKSVKKTQEIVESSSEEEVEDKYEEIDFYVDQREQIYGEHKGDADEEEELANWRANKIDKTCRFFLEAAEAAKYGWRWKCPNGLGCIYKHALPAGYTLKRDIPVAEKKSAMVLEEELEMERAQVQGGTPVTLERFLKWKEEKKAKREKELEQKRLDEVKKAGGKNALSGKALFTYDASLFQDDIDALGDEEYVEEENREDEEEKKEEEGIEEGAEEDEEDGEDNDNENRKASEENNEVIGQDNGHTEQPTETKKKTKKQKKKGDGEAGITVNEDVFLNEADVDLPEDDA